MPTLPTSVSFTDTSVTEAQFKNAITQLREYLSGLLGDTGTDATALSSIGALGGSYQWRDTTFTMDVTYRGAFVAASGTITAYLPLTNGAGIGAGFSVAVRNYGSAVVTVSRQGANTIDGAASLALGAGESAFFISDGGNTWIAFGRTANTAAIAYVNSLAAGNEVQKIQRAAFPAPQAGSAFVIVVLGKETSSADQSAAAYTDEYVCKLAGSFRMAFTAMNTSGFCGVYVYKNNTIVWGPVSPPYLTATAYNLDFACNAYDRFFVAIQGGTLYNVSLMTANDVMFI